MRVRRSLVLLVVSSLATVPALAGCGEDSDATPTTSPTQSEQPSGSSPSPSSATSSTAKPSKGSASPSPSESGSPLTTSSVYYLVDTGARAGFRLAREPWELTAGGPAEAAQEAVEAMIAGPQDPDYATTWNPATEVLGISKVRRVIRVDLSEDARRANVGSEGAGLMVQQLVYTVTEVMGEKARVRLLVEGRPAGELWGVLTWDKPVRRAAPLDVRLLVQIDTPVEGAAVSSPVEVTGDAAAFEANVPWRVLDAGGKVVRRGATLTSEGMTFAPYSFRVRLRPGTYTIEVTEDDPSGGEAPGEPMRDTRTVVVQ